MAHQIDQQFIQKYTLLVREVLSDEAMYVSRNDQHFQKLHNYLFNKTVETPFANIPETDKELFKKYFYLGATSGQPRQDVPFADSAQDQANFFDQFRSQVKTCTYNFSRLDFLRPSFADEKAPTPTFNDYQENLLLRGVVYPLLHNLEQNEISELERQKTGRASTDQEKAAAAANPYQNLGNKILVQGTSGQFDTVLTYAQLEEIAGEEDILRKRGLVGEPMIALLREYIAKRYPDLHIYISADGKVIPFLRGAGISASGMPVVAGGNTMTFAGMLGEMKIRLGRKMQYDAISAGKGTLGLSPVSYQVVDSAGIVTNMNGLTMGLDQEGQGNNTIFFVADNQGVGAKVIVNTGKDRVEGTPGFNFSIYLSPDRDLASNPKIRLEKPELPLLQTPLLALYQERKDIGEFRTVPGRPVREFLPEEGQAPEWPGEGIPAEGGTGTIPTGTAPVPNFAAQKPDVDAMARLREARGRKTEGKAGREQAPAGGPSRRVSRRKPLSKIPFEKAPEYKAPAPKPATQPEGISPVAGQHPGPKPKIAGGGGVSAGRSTPPQKSRVGAIVAGSTILPIAAALGSALAKILIS